MPGKLGVGNTTAICNESLTTLDVTKNNLFSIKVNVLFTFNFKVEAQELKLRKLRALRGQNGTVSNQPVATAAVLADLDSIRGLFNEKEKELVVAVR
jgi:hypothetical protein